MYYSVSDIMKKMNIARMTVIYWVQRGYITPVNSVTYKKDQGYRFEKSEIHEFVKRNEAMEGLNKREAAKYLNISLQFLNKLTDQGVVPSHYQKLGSRSEFTYKFEDLVAIINSNEELRTLRKGELSLYTNGLRLFDWVDHEGFTGSVVKTYPTYLQYNHEINKYSPNYRSGFATSPWPTGIYTDSEE
ncbi:helix-turn-helix domain-containing protein [Geomicrobium sediminis]|uniref:Transposase n=1 Tax=Geomicrobium sediminis TaxID=1347788 RepID=A0ABS2PFX5_9BACL|nr:helix-turn-helix domain-containing protein [Geomicrobium sediminis]MBM7634256.1 transposase [Geomicrobium sediminis]